MVSTFVCAFAVDGCLWEVVVFVVEENKGGAGMCGLWFLFFGVLYV